MITSDRKLKAILKGRKGQQRPYVDRPRHSRQLRCSRAFRLSGPVDAPPALLFSLHAYALFPAQRRGQFFAKLSKLRLQSGVFRIVAGFQTAINRFIENKNRTPKPFVWIADSRQNIDAVSIRCYIRTIRSFMHPIAKIRKAAGIFAHADYRRALRRGAAAGVEHEAMLKLLVLDTVVDIGANRGQFALAVRRCAPGARIISFEPLDGPAAIFRRVFAGDSQVVVHPVAIAPESGLKTMHISGRDDSSSLLPITELQNQLFPVLPKTQCALSPPRRSTNMSRRQTCTA